MSKLLLIARADDTGLGNQTKALCDMLKPDRVLVIDSTPFNGNNKQHLDWYQDYEHMIVKGFPKDAHMLRVLDGMTHVLTCEIAYNYNIFRYARSRGIKTFLQANYEFLDYAQDPRLPQPDTFLMPSYWHLDTMKAKYNDVRYLPPPTDGRLMERNVEQNLNRNGKLRLLHIVGKQAIEDRNGTYDLLEALNFTSSDFELVIRAQTDLPEYRVSDSRVTYDFRNLDDPTELYHDFDAMILPRRYGGLCLPMNEALLSALPVIMTNVSPNSAVLPKNWLCNSIPKGTLHAKTFVDYYSAYPEAIAERIDWLCNMNSSELFNEKQRALELGWNYHSERLADQYKQELGL